MNGVQLHIHYVRDLKLLCCLIQVTNIRLFVLINLGPPFYLRQRTTNSRIEHVIRRTVASTLIIENLVASVQVLNEED